MGTTPAETVKIAADIGFLKTDDEVEHYCRKHDAKVILLKSSNAPSATLYLAPRTRASLPKGISLDPLLRVVELGMDVCTEGGSEPKWQ